MVDLGEREAKLERPHLVSHRRIEPIESVNNSSENWRTRATQVRKRSVSFEVKPANNLQRILEERIVSYNNAQYCQHIIFHHGSAWVYRTPDSRVDAS